jgi:hypothetical protein
MFLEFEDLLCKFLLHISKIVIVHFKYNYVYFM